MRILVYNNTSCISLGIPRSFNFEQDSTHSIPLATLRAQFIGGDMNLVISEEDARQPEMVALAKWILGKLDISEIAKWVIKITGPTTDGPEPCSTDRCVLGKGHVTHCMNKYGNNFNP